MAVHSCVITIYCSNRAALPPPNVCTLQLAQNRAARLALECTQRANINNIHVNFSWLKVEERSLLVFVRGIDMLNAYPTRHSSQSPSPEQTMGGAHYYI
jgi:hypothetical protein